VRNAANPFTDLAQVRDEHYASADRIGRRSGALHRARVTGPARWRVDRRSRAPGRTDERHVRSGSRLRRGRRHVLPESLAIIRQRHHGNHPLPLSGGRAIFAVKSADIPLDPVILELRSRSGESITMSLFRRQFAQILAIGPVRGWHQCQSRSMTLPIAPIRAPLHGSDRTGSPTAVAT
jgi:hypothetical protein